VKKVFKKGLTSRFVYGIICEHEKILLFFVGGNTTMSTFMQKKENVVRKWYVLDAAGKPMGKTAVAAADLLRGKNAPEFTPHVDCGNFVIVINADKAVLTGKKLEQKYYYHHSGYIGGMKAVQAKTMMETKPEKAMELAIKGMLPKNSLGATAFTRLKVYAGEAHKHEAQKPEAYEF
jgi:large subunit ribosomal protein L13